MKIHVSQLECSGHGQCALVNPELFELDDDGFSVIDGLFEIPAGSEDDARKAVQICPSQAISIATS
jgi:ferredoxin